MIFTLNLVRLPSLFTSENWRIIFCIDDKQKDKEHTKHTNDSEEHQEIKPSEIEMEKIETPSTKIDSNKNATETH